jgi:hypothetical protein
MKAARVGLAAVVAIGLMPGAAAAHEERLLVGRVETIEPARKLMVVVDTQGGERRRLEVNPETEVIACRTSAGLSVLHQGALVRVKYLERAGRPGEVRAVLLLGLERRR